VPFERHRTEAYANSLGQSKKVERVWRWIGFTVELRFIEYTKRMQSAYCRTEACRGGSEMSSTLGWDPLGNDSLLDCFLSFSSSKSGDWAIICVTNIAYCMLGDTSRPDRELKWDC
jgi:hypothetical protein